MKFDRHKMAVLMIITKQDEMQETQNKNQLIIFNNQITQHYEMMNRIITAKL